jgi:hypothetical protein
MTAVDWLVDKVIEYQQKGLKISKNLDKLLIEQANEMFERQIKDAYQTSHISMMTADQYYTEKFK